MRIGIDVDDVLAESLPAYLEAFHRRFGHHVKLEEAAWEVFRRYPEISDTELTTFFQELDRSDFLSTRPVYPEAVEAIQQLDAAGHRLYVVTGRLARHQDHTRRLLERAGILHCFQDLIHRGCETAVEFKPRIVRERRLRLLIDDELHVAVAAAQVPIPVLLFDRPWNRGALPAGVSRVTTWAEILRQVAVRAARVP